MKATDLTKIGMLALAGILSAANLAAQTTTSNDLKPFAPSSEYRTWSVGVNGGLLNQSNLIGLRREFDHVKQNFGYGFFVKKQILPALGLQADYVGGKIGGSYKNNANSFFETKMPWSAALSVQITLANINWKYQEPFIKPYVGLGLGAMNFETSATFNGVSNTYESTTKAFVPVSLGLKFTVAPMVNLDLGYQMSMVKSGNLDGFITNSKDIYSYAHLGLEFVLGSKVKPAMASSNPVATMRQEYLAQYDELVGNKTPNGQAENEELKAKLDRLQAELADDDEDGVANRYDKCPNTPAGTKVDGAGCPITSSKVISEEEHSVVREAIRNLEFDLGQATIRSSSFSSLDQVATLLAARNISLKLMGHTDNTGTVKGNLALSKARAEAVKAYLESKGANPSRIEAMGYGSTQPIATNATEEGRQQNRRVEFTLY